LEESDGYVILERREGPEEMIGFSRITSSMLENNPSQCVGSQAEAVGDLHG